MKVITLKRTKPADPVFADLREGDVFRGVVKNQFSSGLLLKLDDTSYFNLTNSLIYLENPGNRFADREVISVEGAFVEGYEE